MVSLFLIGVMMVDMKLLQQKISILNRRISTLTEPMWYSHLEIRIQVMRHVKQLRAFLKVLHAMLHEAKQEQDQTGSRLPNILGRNRTQENKRPRKNRAFQPQPKSKDDKKRITHPKDPDSLHAKEVCSKAKPDPRNDTFSKMTPNPKESKPHQAAQSGFKQHHDGSFEADSPIKSSESIPTTDIVFSLAPSNERNSTPEVSNLGHPQNPENTTQTSQSLDPNGFDHCVETPLDPVVSQSTKKDEPQNWNNAKELVTVVESGSDPDDPHSGHGDICDPDRKNKLDQNLEAELLEKEISEANLNGLKPHDLLSHVIPKILNPIKAPNNDEKNLSLDEIPSKDSTSPSRNSTPQDASPNTHQDAYCDSFEQITSSVLVPSPGASPKSDPSSIAKTQDLTDSNHLDPTELHSPDETNSTIIHHNSPTTETISLEPHCLEPDKCTGCEEVPLPKPEIIYVKQKVLDPGPLKPKRQNPFPSKPRKKRIRKKVWRNKNPQPNYRQNRYDRPLTSIFCPNESARCQGLGGVIPSKHTSLSSNYELSTQLHANTDTPTPKCHDPNGPTLKPNDQDNDPPLGDEKDSLNQQKMKDFTEASTSYSKDQPSKPPNDLKSRALKDLIEMMNKDERHFDKKVEVNLKQLKPVWGQMAQGDLLHIESPDFLKSKLFLLYIDWYAKHASVDHDVSVNRRIEKSINTDNHKIEPPDE